MAGGPVDAALAALNAGCDLVLLCNQSLDGGAALDALLDGLQAAQDQGRWRTDPDSERRRLDLLPQGAPMPWDELMHHSAYQHALERLPCGRAPAVPLALTTRAPSPCESKENGARGRRFRSLWSGLPTRRTAVEPETGPSWFQPAPGGRRRPPPPAWAGVGHAPSRAGWPSTPALPGPFRCRN